MGVATQSVDDIIVSGVVAEMAFFAVLLLLNQKQLKSAGVFCLIERIYIRDVGSVKSLGHFERGHIMIPYPYANAGNEYGIYMKIYNI